MPLMFSFGGRALARSFTLVALLAAGAACSSMQSGDRGDRGDQGDTFGYRWTGPGEPNNFASAHSFCRSTVQSENLANLGPGWVQRGADTVTFNTPDNRIAGMGTSPMTGPVNRRSFDSCMQSQGWTQSGSVEQQPAAAPSAPSTSPTPAR